MENSAPSRESYCTVTPPPCAVLWLYCTFPQRKSEASHGETYIFRSRESAASENGPPSAHCQRRVQVRGGAESYPAEISAAQSRSRSPILQYHTSISHVWYSIDAPRSPLEWECEPPIFPGMVPWTARARRPPGSFALIMATPVVLTTYTSINYLYS